MESQEAIERFVKAINSIDSDACYELMAEDFRFIDSLGAVYRGRKRTFWPDYWAIVPDYDIVVPWVFVSGGTVALPGQAGGTYTPSPGGEVLPENRRPPRPRGGLWLRAARSRNGRCTQTTNPYQDSSGSIVAGRRSRLMTIAQAFTFTTLALGLTLGCSERTDLRVVREVTGPGETNCYLVFDTRSAEAALVDVGGAVDSLAAVIEAEGLSLKYIFATHGHMDHMEGTPAVRGLYPEAQFCCSAADYEDFLVCREWAIEHMDPREIEAMKQDPEYARWFAYDMSIFGEPDVLLEDGQSFALGDFTIRTIHSPGHSRGSMCLHVGNVLFSGDVLFHRQVGHTGFMHGSMEQLTTSVQRLYRELPDATVVYPGHGEPTDIGSEKSENEVIRAVSG